MGAGESVVVYYTGVRREDGGLTELLGRSEKLVLCLAARRFLRSHLPPAEGQSELGY